MMASLTDNNLGTQPVCQNCTTSTTPLWRRDENGSVLCNACGLFLKLHGSPRPISLKTDVIKSRNRVKTSGPPQKKKSLFDANGLPASQSTPSSQVQYSQQQQPNGHVHSTNGSDSPTSRTQTPTLHHPSNIAPQHLFDGISQSTDQVFHSNFPNSTYPRQPSPGSNSSDRHLGPPPTYEDMLRDNTQMKTRISELEVINDLYRGTVSQYEQGSAPQAEMVPKEADVDAENGLATALLQSQRREEELKRKVESLETQMAELKAELEGRERKKARVEDVGEYPEPPNGLHEP